MKRLKSKDEIIKYYQNLYVRTSKRRDIYQNFFNENYKVLSKMFDVFEQLQYDDIKIYKNKNNTNSKKWIIFLEDLFVTPQASLPFMVSFAKMGFNVAVIQSLQDEFYDFIDNTDKYLGNKLEQIIRADDLIKTIDGISGLKGIVGEGVGAFVGNWFALNHNHLVSELEISFNISLSTVTDPLNFIKQIYESYAPMVITRKKFRNHLKVMGLRNIDYLINSNNPIFNKMIPSFYIHAIDDQIASVLSLSEFLIKKYKKYNFSEDWKLIYNYGEHNSVAIQHFNDIALKIFDFFIEKNIFKEDELLSRNLNKEYIFDQLIEEKTELLVYFDKGENYEKKKK